MMDTVVQSNYKYSLFNFRIHLFDELRFRTRTSALWWCYTGCIAILMIPALLVTVYYRVFQVVISWQVILNPLLFLLLFFYIINFDTFSREKELNMLDQVTMHSLAFNTVYLARMIVNAILLIVPAGTSLVIYYLAQAFSLDHPGYSFDADILVVCIMYFLFWYLLATAIFTGIEVIFRGLNKVVIYLSVIVAFISLFSFLTRSLPELSFITGVLSGEKLASDIFFSIIVLATGSIISLYIIYRTFLLLTKSELTISDMEDQREKRKIMVVYKRITQQVKKLDLSRLRVIYYPSLIIIYLMPVLLVNDPSMITALLAPIFTIHLFLVQVHVLLRVFPRITMEKEYNMEELMLSRMTVKSYFFSKLLLLLYSLFKPVIIPLVLLSTVIPGFIDLIPFLLLHSIYLISVLLTIWRILPAKNLLNSALLSILGLDILLISLFSFIGYGLFSVIIAPVFSNLIFPIIFLDPSAFQKSLILMLQIETIIVPFSVMLLLSSHLMIKADVRFE